MVRLGLQQYHIIPNRHQNNTRNTPEMDDLRTILNDLEDRRLDYVQARSKSNSDAEAYREAGISKTIFYSWPAEEREKLNAIAQRMKRETVARAWMAIQDAAADAARVKVEGLRSRDERIRQSAATDILDRNMGKPKQAVDVTSNGETIKAYTIITPDDWDENSGDL